jgi:predicted anti-sigma-YlaC factor YlaD
MAKHPDTDLVPYLRGQLPPAERERVERHLAECPDCRQDTELLRELLEQVARSIGRPPDVTWAHYRAELREKLEARRARRAWWSLPVPMALSASVVGVLLLLAVWTGYQMTGGEPFTPEQVSLGSELGLLQEYQVVEQLDLLEDLDVIRNLDGLAAGRPS